MRFIWQPLVAGSDLSLSGDIYLYKYEQRKCPFRIPNLCVSVVTANRSVTSPGCLCSGHALQKRANATVMHSSTGYWYACSAASALSFFNVGVRTHKKSSGCRCVCVCVCVWKAVDGCGQGFSTLILHVGDLSFRTSVPTFDR
jgi:hypothetical protein